MNEKKDIEKKVEDNPGDAGALSELAYFYADRGELGKAIGTYEKLVEIDPDNAEAFYNLGVAYGRLALEDIAVEILWEDKTDEEDYLENAVKNYLRSLEIDPANIHARNNLGLLYKAMDWPDKAAEEFELSLKTEPDQPEIRKLLDEVR